MPMNSPPGRALARIALRCRDKLRQRAALLADATMPATSAATRSAWKPDGVCVRGRGGGAAGRARSRCNDQGPERTASRPQGPAGRAHGQRIAWREQPLASQPPPSGCRAWRCIARSCHAIHASSARKFRAQVRASAANRNRCQRGEGPNAVSHGHDSKPSTTPSSVAPIPSSPSAKAMKRRQLATAIQGRTEAEGPATGQRPCHRRTHANGLQADAEGE